MTWMIFLVYEISFFITVNCFIPNWLLFFWPEQGLSFTWTPGLLIKQIVFAFNNWNQSYESDILLYYLLLSLGIFY